MASFDVKLWQQILDYLRRRYIHICRQWFDDLSPVKIESGLLTVSTDNAVQQRYLQRKCREQFIEAAQSVTGSLISVCFVCTGPSGSATTMLDRFPSPPAVGSPPPPRTTHQHLTPRSGDPDAELFDQAVISPDHCFDTFVRGPENQLSAAAAEAVADQPAGSYNPLFIHGASGLGKTHLLQAICRAIQERHPDQRCCYVSCEMFTNQFLWCVQQGQMARFRDHYRHVHVLIVDDIHFLAQRERTQEEFFHTFNALYQNGRQIVLASDASPAEIAKLEERLTSRFQWGLVTHISRPSYETRVAIARCKSQLRGVDLPAQVVDYVAGRVDSSVRELEGAITTIQGSAVLQNRPIDLSLAKLALGDVKNHGPAGPTTLHDIIEAVTDFYCVKLSDLQSKRRHKSIALPRQVCMWLARKRTRFSLQEIGGYFGGRDHTTVMHSIKAVDHRVSTDTGFARELDQIASRVSRSADSRSGFDG